MRHERVMRPLLMPAALLMACGRPDAASVADSESTGAVPHGVSSAAGDWPSDIGELLVVPSDSDNSAAVLYPADPSASLTGSSIATLVNAAGDSTRVRLVASDSQQCDAPLTHVAGTLPASWTVGTVGRSAQPMRMQSIARLAAADSFQLAATLARLASTLDSRKTSRFAGLPFAVSAGRQFQAEGRTFVAGHLVRRLNQEATPLEEHTLIIGERLTTAPRTEPYMRGYSQRSEGSEDSAEHFDVLAAFRIRQTPFILVERDQVARTIYNLLERTDDGTWRVRWSRTLSC